MEEVLSYRSDLREVATAKNIDVLEREAFKKRSYTEGNISPRRTITGPRPTDSKEYLAPWFYQTTIEIEDESLTHFHNIRNLSLSDWRHFNVLPTPTISPFHVHKIYDIEKLKEIWVGFSPHSVWITFAFAPCFGITEFPSEAFNNVDEFYRRIDNFDYLTITTESPMYKSKHSKVRTGRKKKFLFCTDLDIINQLKSKNDYPFPIRIFPILEPASTQDEMMQRRHKARQFLLIAIRKVNAVTKGSIFELGKELGMEISLPAWVKSVFKHKDNGMKMLWETGMIHTDVKDFDAACVTFTANSILAADGVSELKHDEFSRVLYGNLRENIGSVSSSH